METAEARCYHLCTGRKSGKPATGILAEFLEDVYNLDHDSDYRMAGKTWIMHEDGLESVR